MLENIGGGEILLILIVILVFFGPKKIPELARSLGIARKEFTTATAGSEQDEPATSQDALIDVARKLGISTEGKTRDQISTEIVGRKAAVS